MNDLPVPRELEDLVLTWHKAGRPSQPGTAWPARSWTRTFSEHRAYLADLPNPIDRSSVAQVCASASSTQEQAVQGFIATMIWGYGRIGYGPFRTARVLSENPESPEVLQQVARRVHTDGGPSAFEWLAEHRLRGLGVAFATKFLFFCGGRPNGAETALILDRLVRSWLDRNVGWSPRPDWHVADYGRYINVVVAWAAELGVSAADIEYLMFAGEVESDPGSQWWHPFGAEEVSVPAAVPLGATSEEAVVLEALDDAAEAFDDLSDMAARDRQDFESGLRHLRRIILSRARRRA